jgi:hypothetical protein
VVHATIRPGGDLKLADLAEPALPPGEPPPPAEPLPAVHIADLSVQGARILFTDRDRAEPFATELSPLTFRVRDLSTHISGGDAYELDVTAFGDTRIRWRGTFELEPLASAGELELSSIPLPEVGRFLGDARPFELAAGTISFRALQPGGFAGGPAVHCRGWRRRGAGAGAALTATGCFAFRRRSV